MSERQSYDPPIKCWVVPSDDYALAPLPALLHSETEHEIIVSEYDPVSHEFSGGTRERRATAYREFSDCQQAMFDERNQELEKIREQSRNLASVCSHIYNLVPVPFPEEAYKAFTAPPEQPDVVDSEPEPAPEPAPKPAIQRPSRRRR